MPQMRRPMSFRKKATPSRPAVTAGLRSGTRTFIMGVLNCTPDSFFDGGKYFRKRDAVSRAVEMCRSGADIIDIGGQSTRPGAREIGVSEELDRVVPVVAELAKRMPCMISVDTYRHEVAVAALKAGASMVNDITGMRKDPHMARAVAPFGPWVVLMHIKGTPETMQRRPVYRNLMADIRKYLLDSAREAVASGIRKDRIILDPGIGFGKTVRHNLDIIKKLYQIRNSGYPVLIGVSRKSFLGKLTGKDAAEREFATAAACAIAIANGADIIRVHDPEHMKDVAAVTDAIVRRRR